MIKELDLLEKQDIREKVIGRTEVLDKVKDLLLLPNTEYATTEQVANYYEVEVEAIRKLATRNKDELESDGYKTFRKNNVIKLLNGHDVQLEGSIGKSIVTLEDGSKIDIPNRGLRLFPKRSILRVGMLLRDSKIAKEIRTRLLDIVHDAEQGKADIIQSVSDEITQEQGIYLRMGKAVQEGDIEEVLICNTELHKLKNKRIEELESTNKQITSNSLTIIESKAVINRIVRSIAMKRYKGMFGVAWGELYKKLNYKLGINIKKRTRQKGESYLDTLTEEEVFKTEKIVRNWAVDNRMDLDKLLKIA